MRKYLHCFVSMAVKVQEKHLPLQKMVLSTEQLAQKLYQFCATGTETVPSYSQKLNS